MKKLLALAALMSSAAFGYYHFVHYNLGISPFNAIPEKFDLSALPGNTITYQISEGGPAHYASTDGFAAVVSQIRGAAKVWSEIETTELRLRFGGIIPTGANQNAQTPSIDVVFEDLPPGVNGYGGPTVKNEIVGASTGAFISIQRSVVVLAKDIASRPSWSEQYFLTAVHEFGHALGLQHSFASGAMATEITRATTKIRPIFPDDVVGLSLLYPTKTFREGLGAVAGRVTLGGNDGVGLASVVAIAPGPGGAAIGTLTHPDGTYRIDGLPPGQYFLYAHPLPPTLQGEATPGNVVLPVDSAGRAMPGGQQFDTVFFPASRIPFATVYVTANASEENVNFSVTRRNAPTAIHSVQTYSFPGQVAVKPAHLYTSGARNLVVMTGSGVVQSGLQIASIGGALTVPSNGIRPYPGAPESYIQTEFQFGQLTGAAPVHLIFSRNNDLYVLPYGLRVVERAAPRINSVARVDSTDVVISGSGLNASTRVAFEGVAGTFRFFDEESGRLTVTAPVAAPGSTLHVVAFGSDGQSSLFTQAAATLATNGGPEPAAGATALSTSTLPAGTESVIEITGTNFAEGMTSIGFGTPDIDVRRVWFPSPNRALANIWVAPGAAGSTYSFTILNGLRLTTQSGALQVSSARSGWISTPSSTFVSGAAAAIQVNGLAISSLTALQLTVNDRPAQVTGVDGSTVIFTMPSGLTPGVAVVRFQSGADAALPLAITVSQPQAVIASVTAGFGTPITAERPARYGELMNLVVAGLPENFAAAGTQPRVTMTIGGIDHRLITVSPSGGFLQLQFTIQTVVPQGVQPLIVTVDGVAVTTYSLPVRAF